MTKYNVPGNELQQLREAERQLGFGVEVNASQETLMRIIRDNPDIELAKLPILLKKETPESIQEYIKQE